MNTYIRVFFIALLAFSYNIQASDLAKEKRWSDQVVDAIVDGDAVWLNDGKSKFLGIFTEADSNNGEAVIVMHGTGAHPNWQQVVQPLRTGLTEHGWNTLSIQMPILANEASYEDYAPLYDEVAPRIDAAIRYLKEAGMKRIVLVGHSKGATMAAYYLTLTTKEVNGFVAIGSSGLAKDDRMNVVKSIEKIQLPILDLYGTEDLESVLMSTKQRAAAAKKANNKQYSQLQIEGNHFYDDKNDELIETVSAWLGKLK